MNFSISRGIFNLYGLIENPGKQKIVLLLHGFTGDMNGPSNIFILLSQQLQNLGYTVCRFNCIGTPPSEGSFKEVTLESEVQDTEVVISYLINQGYKNISVLGESMGGSILSCLDFSRLNNIIFWYPAFDFLDTDFPELFLSKESKNKLKQQGYIECDGFKVGNNFINQIEKINLYGKLKNIKNPVLILHGSADSEVPVTQSEKAYELLGSKDKKIRIIDGAEHCFRDEQKKVIELTINFIEKT